MKPNKYDKYVFLICLLIFLYSFFVVGYEPISRSDRIQEVLGKGKIPDNRLLTGDPREIVSLEYPSSLVIAPFIAVLYLCFMVFKKELYPVNHHFMMRQYYMLKKRFKERRRNP